MFRLVYYNAAVIYRKKWKGAYANSASSQLPEEYYYERGYAGPQKRLYIPGPLLKPGENEIILFETEGKAAGTIFLRDAPNIG